MSFVMSSPTPSPTPIIIYSSPTVAPQQNKQTSIESDLQQTMQDFRVYKWAFIVIVIVLVVLLAAWWFFGRTNNTSSNSISIGGSSVSKKLVLHR